MSAASGFWVENFTLAYAGLEIQAWVIVGVALGVSLLTLFFHGKNMGFLLLERPCPEGHLADTP